MAISCFMAAHYHTGTCVVGDNVIAWNIKTPAQGHCASLNGAPGLLRTTPNVVLKRNHVDYMPILRRITPAAPSSPLPSSAILPGSGVALRFGL